MYKTINEKNKVLFVLLALCPASLALAMQPLDDQSLATTTGQDGINIGVGFNKIDVEQISLIDKDGITSPIMNKDYKSPAALVVAGALNSPINVNFVGANASPTLNMVMDTDGGNGQAFANVAVSFGNQISAVKVSPFAVYLASANSVSTASNSKSIFNSAGTLNTGVNKIFEVGSASNNFEISFNNSNRPQMNVQLGNVPQGQMIKFSGAIQAICGTGSGCPISIISGDTAAKFDFQMKATDVANGFALNGFYAGVEPTGAVFGNTGRSSKMNVALNNLMLGRDGANASTTFNGLSNGSMGSFGAVGASVKDLKVNIRGL